MTSYFYVLVCLSNTDIAHCLQESERAVMQTNIEAINQDKAPIFSIDSYAVMELLGSGAFGSVYKVCAGCAMENQSKHGWTQTNKFCHL